jgi:hypothetical protein
VSRQPPDVDWSPLTVFPVGTTQTWFEWEVSAYGNNSQPFSFRAVNAQGTAQEKSGGGFYTGQFWVRQESSADDKPSSTATTASPTTAASSETPKPETTDQKASDVTSNPPPSSSSSTPTSASQNATSTSDTKDATQTSSSSTTLPAAPVTTENEAVDTEGKTVNNNNDNNTSNSSNDPNTTLLGVGIGVGVGLGVTAASIGVWVFLWRRRRRNRNRNSGSGRKNEADEQGGLRAEKGRDTAPDDEGWYGEAAHRNEKSGGMRAHVDAFELPPQGAVIEAPGHRMDPCELAAGRWDGRRQPMQALGRKRCDISWSSVEFSDFVVVAVVDDADEWLKRTQ